MNFRPIIEGRRLAGWLKTIPANGVYLIREAGLLGGMLYIGESHTGRLKKTLLRHFQHWKGKTAGPTFPRSKVSVAILKTRAENALDLQNALIEEHRPRHNIAGKPGFWED